MTVLIAAMTASLSGTVSGSCVTVSGNLAVTMNGRAGCHDSPQSGSMPLIAVELTPLVVW